MISGSGGSDALYGGAGADTLEGGDRADFLMAERCLFPPQARFTARRLAAPMLPKSFQPRGAPGAA